MLLVDDPSAVGELWVGAEPTDIAPHRGSSPPSTASRSGYAPTRR